MHIAVCDDNIVDRKQMERLLTREADKRRGSISGLYVDSFGSTGAMLATPLDYDVYFIDFNSEGVTGIDLARKLIESGKKGVMVLCCGSINYRDMDFMEKFFFLDKPVSVEALSNMIGLVSDFIRDSAPTIEIREDNGNSFRILESEFIYAVSRGEFITITMSESRTATIRSTFDSFYNQLLPYESLLAINRRTLINASHIIRLEGFNVIMSGGIRFFLSPFYRRYAKFVYDSLNR